MPPKLLVTLALIGSALVSRSQLCTAPGSTPETALFVCGSSSFSLFTPAFCGTKPIPVSCPATFPYQNKNPNFLRFACFGSGTLGFKITPTDINANFNWQLFDITSTNPSDIFLRPEMFVAANWSSEPGETGASVDGTDLLVCAGGGLNTFSKMPDIQLGHSYMLLVSNESNSTSGFEIIFEGGSGTITDAIDPRLREASMNCDRTHIQLRCNKSIICNSIAANGSDFIISGGYSVIAAVPVDCNPVIGSDVIDLTLNAPLPFGSYQLQLAKGSDGNTLMDICSREVPETDFLTIVSSAASFTAMDNIVSTRCAPAFVELVFIDPILCNSIARDGSDFLITGPQTIVPGITVPACSTSGTTKIIRLDLPPGYLPGDYQVKLVSGSDGNTILNECGVPTPAGSTVSFTTSSSVNANFTNTIPQGCSGAAEIQFTHDGASGVNNWSWDFGNGNTSTVRNPSIHFNPGRYTVKLTVSNGVCTHDFSKQIVVSDAIKAVFSIPKDVCPGDAPLIKQLSTGVIDNYHWDFGNGETSTSKFPRSPVYINTGVDATYPVQLTVSNSQLGCTDVLTQLVHVPPHCHLAVPNAFSPNNDGKNDFLYPLNAYRVKNLEFIVYNRMGQPVFISHDPYARWDGKIQGVLQDTGIFAWMMKYTDENGRKVLEKGTVLLVR